MVSAAGTLFVVGAGGVLCSARSVGVLWMMR